MLLARQGELKAMACVQELVQVGMEGLTKAIDRFEPQRGFRFSTYAVYWIRGAIQKTIEDNISVVQTPRSWFQKARNALTAKNELKYELGRMPTDLEIGKRMGVSSDKARMYLNVWKDSTSLDAPINAEGDTMIDNMVVRAASAAATNVCSTSLTL